MHEKRVGMTLVQLSNAHLALDLCPALGGAITALRWCHPESGKIDLLRPMSTAAGARGMVEEASAFPLTPFSNRLRDGRFTFRGSHISMPRNTGGPHVEHGHGWQRPWHVVRAGSEHVVLSYAHTPDAWPYKYEMQQRFRLAGARLTIDLVTRNCGDRAMPYGFGLHPYFPRTPECILRADVSGIWEVDDEVMPTRLISLPRTLDPRRGMRVNEHNLDNVLVGWDGHAEIIWPERKARLMVTAGRPLGFLVVYTPPGADYFCAEPVSNCTDAFNLAAERQRDTGMLVIEPAAQVSARISFVPGVLG